MDHMDTFTESQPSARQCVKGCDRSNNEQNAFLTLTNSAGKINVYKLIKIEWNMCHGRNTN